MGGRRAKAPLPPVFILALKKVGEYD